MMALRDHFGCALTVCVEIELPFFHESNVTNVTDTPQNKLHAYASACVAILPYWYDCWK